MNDKDEIIIPVNEYQTPITKEFMESMPQEVQEWFMDFMTNVEFIQNLTSTNRRKAKDMPKDNQGRIIIDFENPHIIENADYFRQPALHFMKYGCYTKLKPNSNPTSEYRKFWEEERRRIREGYVRESDGEWVTGFCYFFLNYTPMMVNVIREGTEVADRIESMPFFFEGIYWRFHYLYNAKDTGQHAIELAKRGAHPYFEKVMTPSGWKSWGDIQVGDRLFGSSGEVIIEDITANGLMPTYKITLRDGREIYASDDHLWQVKVKSRKTQSLLTTKELLSIYKAKRTIDNRNPSGIEYRVHIPKNDGVEFDYHETKVDPYTFGLLLGDGCFRHKSCYFTQLKKDLEEERRFIPYEIIKWSGKYAHRINIPNWIHILKEYKLYWLKSEDKFIPDEFKYNSREVRLNLLRGLMDSDGGIHGGVPNLAISSEKLRDDVMELARSLGYNTAYIKRKSGYKVNGVFKECLPTYDISIYGGTELFNLTRKKEKVHYKSNNAKSRRDSTIITNIEYVGEELCKCVKVSSKDGLYLIGDYVLTHNCSKSYSLASIMVHNLLFGESERAKKRIVTVLLAYQKEYLKDNKDGTLSKFIPILDFVRMNTPFPRLMLKNSPNDMSWQMGYLDSYGIRQGNLNQVLGVAAKDDPDKARGKRGWILVEEMGTFKGLLALYDTTRRSVEDGKYAFACMYLLGTANEKESSFESAKTLLYKTKGYRIYTLRNVFDKKKNGNKTFGFFFGAYVNRAGCYNHDGVSDVTKALMEILMARYKAKYSADPKSVLRVIAEDPITPAEAIVKVKAAYFPVADVNERIQQIDSNPRFYDDTLVGALILKDGKVSFTPTNDMPIRQWGVANDTPGAIEIFQLPKTDANGKIPPRRYGIGHDPVDNDQAESDSLSSTFVFDFFEDEIVAEFTGRKMFADDNYEIVRRLAIMYNAKVCYEAHPYSQKVITPDGIKKWGDIKIGDKLFAPNGIVTVTDIPIDEYMPVYKIKFTDGREVYASDNHIWAAYRLNYHPHHTELYTTKQMMDIGIINRHRQHTFSIPNNEAVEFEEKEVPIDPYTLGLLIAEGAFTKFKKQDIYNKQRNFVQMSSGKEDAEFYKTVLPYKIKYIGTKGYSYHVYIDDVKTKLDNLGLTHHNSHDKFIPELYLYNSKKVRMELLKGLMDGDGCALTKGACVYITTSKRLSKDIMLLCRSLGISCNYQKGGKARKQIMNGRSYDCAESYRIAIHADRPIFKLPRKIASQHIYSAGAKGSKADSILNKISIESIEFSHYEMGKCVTVSSEDGLYLIGDYIVTHNCNKKGLFAYFKKMHSEHYMLETPEYLKDKQLLKTNNIGSNAYGVTATAAINNYQNELIKDWLNTPRTIITKNESGEEEEHTITTTFTIKNRALLDELANFSPEVNVDRIHALGMVMLYRQEMIVLFGGDMSRTNETSDDKDYAGNDEFFVSNYNNRWNAKNDYNLNKAEDWM